MPPPPTTTAPPTAGASPRPGGRRRQPPWAALALVALLAAFGAGVVHLFHLRFDAGDVYPPYSTFRSDPLGAKVFYESLRSLPGFSTERSLRPLHSLGVPVMSRSEADHGEPGFTCFYLGANPDQWPYLLPKDAAKRLERIANLGGRVVVTFEPSTRLPTDSALTSARDMHKQDDPKKDKEQAKDKNGQPDPGKARGNKDNESEKEKENTRKRLKEMLPKFDQPDLAADWQIDFRRVAASAETDAKKLKAGGPLTAQPSPTPSGADIARHGQAVPARPTSGSPLPPGLTVADEPPVAWHTAVDFQLDTPAAKKAGWRALYERDGHAVVVARPYGKAGGELVLASDSYFLSNEGLHEAAHPDLLAALVGPGKRLLFDESHFGISENPGMVTLARRYRLQGALAALGLLAGLFVWRNAVSLLPPRPVDAQAAGERAAVTGRDAAAGFLNLLRRGVAPRDLPALCVSKWQQHLSPATGPAADSRQLATPANAAKVQEVLAAAGRHSPAALYRTMCERLRRNDQGPMTRAQ